MLIKTESGSVYCYRGNTVSRMSEVPILGLHLPLVQEQVAWADPVTVGARWRFACTRGVITTSRVIGFDFEAQVLD